MTHTHLPPKAISTPEHIAFTAFDNAEKAYEQLVYIYQRNTLFIRTAFSHFINNENPPEYSVRAFYPAIRLRVTDHKEIDSRLSYGYATEPGMYSTTITQPELYKSYLLEQLSLLIKNHGLAVEIGESKTPIPLHFSFTGSPYVERVYDDTNNLTLRNYFDVPDLAVMDDAIVNGTLKTEANIPAPLAPFTAPRIDYSLHRLQHYTASAPDHFQSFVLFTNYQFYVDAFCNKARELVRDPNSGYSELVEPGNLVTTATHNPEAGSQPFRLPQMPAYHLKRPDGQGITLVNMGVGPSNAKTITDHIAVLRPSAWIMLGHCAGLRNTQRLGDYVLAHGYVRDDHVLDADLPLWVPIPPLAEVQVALEQAVAQVSGLDGWELKRIMRTGTVASIDNRNWELRDHDEPVQRLSQSRAIGLDMESATIAANGFRFRVPYGTLLCVSDKPLHGELKLPGMATDFYRTQVNQHLYIGMRALEILREMPSERLQSRKLRSFIETAFK
ncbi:AMP nucleosidase [Advenella sp. WQ 585]|uniref:AMP nucleosidase n=1 Tax=Advenella mandrilli TaxID=2800330 RepID=A0ABS1E8P0_9BURK|nr:AMP nucleosidase [Advenella mandrilli]MBK1779661.1 AMP nucleosidase [Advenella mandrilli]